MKILEFALLTSLTLATIGCGGGNGPSGPNEPYSFVWTGVVESIQDGFFADAIHPEVAVGDTYTVRLNYDPAQFTDAGATADGREYQAHDGASLVYSFQSGYVVVRPIGIVRARENGGQGQWNWKGLAGELWFQANESVGSSFGGVFPASFEVVHEAFMANQDSFSPSSGNHLELPDPDPANAFNISFHEQAMGVVAN